MLLQYSLMFIFMFSSLHWCFTYEASHRYHNAWLDVDSCSELVAFFFTVLVKRQLSGHRSDRFILYSVDKDMCEKWKFVEADAESWRHTWCVKCVTVKLC